MMKLESLRKKVARHQRTHGRIVVMRTMKNDLFFDDGAIHCPPLPYKPQDSSSGLATKRQKKRGAVRSSPKMSAFERIALERGGTVTDLKVRK